MGKVAGWFIKALVIYVVGGIIVDRAAKAIDRRVKEPKKKPYVDSNGYIVLSQDNFKIVE